MSANSDPTKLSLTQFSLHCQTFRLIDPPLICRLSIAGKHLLRIRKAAGSHWNEEPYLSVRLAWRERYRHPRMIMFWHKVFKDLPRSFTR